MPKRLRQRKRLRQQKRLQQNERLQNPRLSCGPRLLRQRPRGLRVLCGVAAICALLGGCTTTDEIIIDRKGVDMARYAADKAECEAYSDEVRTVSKAARGAGTGAVVGGAVGAIIGDSTESAVRGAGVGAVSGGVRGAAEGERQEIQVVKRCLRGRGYRVLN